MERDWQQDGEEEAHVASAVTIDLDCGVEAPPSILQAERRIHVRAYNRWAALRRGRPFPGVEDLASATLQEFSHRAVLLRYADPVGTADPEILFVGRALREEAGLEGDTLPTFAGAPAGSLLQRLASRHREIASHRAPVGIEAEFAGMFGEATLYRGVMLPFSSDGSTIDHIYGVVNWKLAAPDDLPAEIHTAVDIVHSTPMARAVPGDLPFPRAEDEATRAHLRTRPAVAEVMIDALPFEGEFVLLVGRRDGQGRVAVVAAMAADEGTLARAANQPLPPEPSGSSGAAPRR